MQSEEDGPRIWLPIHGGYQKYMSQKSAFVDMNAFYAFHGSPKFLRLEIGQDVPNSKVAFHLYLVSILTTSALLNWCFCTHQISTSIYCRCSNEKKCAKCVWMMSLPAITYNHSRQPHGGGGRSDMVFKGAPDCSTPPHNYKIFMHCKTFKVTISLSWPKIICGILTVRVRAIWVINFK